MIDPKFILQQDNEPKHSAKVTKNHLQRKEEQEVLEVMSWPPRALISTSPSVSGFEEAYIHRRCAVSCPRCLEQPTSRVPLKTRFKYLEELMLS